MQENLTVFIVKCDDFCRKIRRAYRNISRFRFSCKNRLIFMQKWTDYDPKNLIFHSLLTAWQIDGIMANYVNFLTEKLP